MRARHALGLAGLLALTGCQRANDYDTKDYAAMNAIPLKTVCVGRLQIDLPQKGLKEWSANFDRAEVTRMRFPVQDEESFWAAVEKRKRELESQRHETEPSLLSLFERVDNSAAIVMYRNSRFTKSGLYMDRYLWLGDRGYHFETGAWPNDLKNQVNRYSQIFTYLVPHDAWDRPQASGFCIDGATVTGKAGEINAGVTVHLPTSWPKGELWFSTGEVDDPSQVQDTPGTDPREFSAIGTMEIEQEGYRGMAKDDPEARSEPTYPKEFDALRKRNHALGSRRGNEAVWRKALNNGAMIYKFLWINEESPSTPANPGITLQMDVGDEEGPDKKPPPEEEMFALWDAVLASLKPRPGA